MFRKTFRPGLVMFAVLSFVSNAAIAEVSETLITTTIDGQPPNGSITHNVTTDDGRYTVFTSEASNLVLGDTNGVSDVFLFDSQDQSLMRVSTDASGGQLETASIGTEFLNIAGRRVLFTTDQSYDASFERGNVYGLRIKGLDSGELVEVPYEVGTVMYAVRMGGWTTTYSLLSVSGNLNSYLFKRHYDYKYDDTYELSDEFTLFELDKNEETSILKRKRWVENIEIPTPPVYSEESLFHEFSDLSINVDTRFKLGDPAMDVNGVYLGLLAEGKLHIHHHPEGNRYNVSVNTAPIPSIKRSAAMKMYGNADTVFLRETLDGVDRIVRVYTKSNWTKTFTPEYQGKVLSKYNMTSPFQNHSIQYHGDRHRYLWLTPTDGSEPYLFDTYNNVALLRSEFEQMDDSERSSKRYPDPMPRAEFRDENLYLLTFSDDISLNQGVTGLEGSYRIRSGLSLPQRKYWVSETIGGSQGTSVIAGEGSSGAGWYFQETGSEGDYLIRNLENPSQTGCMGTISWSETPVLFNCSANDERQLWRVSTLGGGYNFQNHDSGLCLASFGMYRCDGLSQGFGLESKTKPTEGLNGSYKIHHYARTSSATPLTPESTSGNQGTRVKPLEDSNHSIWEIAPINGGTYRIRNQAVTSPSKGCLGSISWSPEPILLNCDAQDEKQQWTTIAHEKGLILQNQGNDKCLELYGWSFDGTDLTLFKTCKSTAAQALIFEQVEGSDGGDGGDGEPAFSGSVEISSVNSSAYVGWQSQNAGAHLQLQSGSEKPAWTVHYNGLEDNYTLNAEGITASRCLALPSWSNSLPILNRCDNGDRQKWNIEGSESEGYSLMNTETEECLSRIDVSNDKLRVRECNGSNLQQFNIH